MLFHGEPQDTPTVDCDVHNSFRGARDLLPYLKEPWRTGYADGDLGYPGTGYYNEVGLMHRDSVAPDGTAVSTSSNTCV
ncbi:MAG: hypothetical protein M1118_11580 [Chloroflexi bacterium]|nr:hypothetical protein [Chloroflexota bacterium]